MLKEGGSEVTTRSRMDGFEYRLYVVIKNSRNFLVRFIDNKRLKILWEESISVKNGYLKRKAADLVDRILDRIYRIR